MPRKKMPGLDEIKYISERTDEFLGDLVDAHQNNIIGAIEKLEKRIIDNLTLLSTRKDGRLEGIKVNMKQAQSVHKQMVKSFANEYGIPVEKLIGDFSGITDFVEDSYGYLGESTKFTGVNKETIEVLKQGFADQYSRYGADAQEKVTKAMYDSVIAGEPFSSLLATVRGALVGHVDRAGRPMVNYVKQHAFDSIMNFNNQVNLMKTEQLGMTHFLYYGNIMGTTREFCISHVGKIYSKEVIESWNDDQWAGKAGPAMTHRGGYNCRHHWRGVRPEWVGLEEGEDIPEDVIAPKLPSASKKSLEKIASAPEKKKATSKTKKLEFWDISSVDTSSRLKNIETEDLSQEGPKVFKTKITDSKGEEKANAKWYVFEKGSKKELFINGAPGDPEYAKALVDELREIGLKNNFTHLSFEHISTALHEHLTNVLGDSVQKGLVFEWSLAAKETPRFGLPLNSPVEKWLKHRQKWDPVQTLEDAKLQFQNKYKIKNFDVDFVNGKTSEEIVRACNEAGETMANMYQKAPGINDHLMKAKELDTFRIKNSYEKVTDEYYETLLERYEYMKEKGILSPTDVMPTRETTRIVGGFYWESPVTGKRKLVTVMDESFDPGFCEVLRNKFTSINDRFCTLRHEYGHYIQDSIPMREQSDWWTDWFETRKKGNELFHSVSRYAATNDKELWAEIFAVSTHPWVNLNAYYAEVAAGSNRLEKFIFRMRDNLKVVPEELPGQRRFLIPSKKPSGVAVTNAAGQEPLLANATGGAKIDKPKGYKSKIEYEFKTTGLENAEASKEYINAATTEMKIIEKNFPNLGDLLHREGKKLEIDFYEDVICYDGVYYGGYSKPNHKIDFIFKKSGFRAKKYVLDGTKEVVDDSPQGLLRNTIGQAIYRNLDSVNADRWADIIHEMEKGTGINISSSATFGTSHTFGEYFSVFTSGYYKRGDLPLRIESFFDDITGARLSAPKRKLATAAKDLAACLI